MNINKLLFQAPQRGLIHTCLLQIQFLCAQQHLECGHWRIPVREYAHDKLSPRIKKTHCAFFNKRTFPTAGRCGSSLQYCRLPGTTHLRQQRRDRSRLSRAIRKKNFTYGDRRSASAPGPGDIFLFFPSACPSWQVQLRIESSCPMRRSESDSARPGQDRLGSASPSLCLPAGLLAGGR